MKPVTVTWATLSDYQQGIFYMHHPIDRITQMGFLTMHSTHFILRLKWVHVAKDNPNGNRKKPTHFRHYLGYPFRLAARVILYESTGWNEKQLCGSTMKDRSDDPSHHGRTLLPQSYISLPSFRPRQKPLGLGWGKNRLSRYDIRAERALPPSITVIARLGYWICNVSKRNGWKIINSRALYCFVINGILPRIYRTLVI